LFGKASEIIYMYDTHTNSPQTTERNNFDTWQFSNIYECARCQWYTTDQGSGLTRTLEILYGENTFTGKSVQRASADTF
jgi:hypothetical protein